MLFSLNFVKLMGNFCKVFAAYKQVRDSTVFLYPITGTGPRSAVGNVSGNRCESDCRSRGREFDPGPVPYFRGD